jgi:hypothetical protein
VTRKVEAGRKQSTEGKVLIIVGETPEVMGASGYPRTERSKGLQRNELE